MVNISRESDNFIFEIVGLHKLWALKSQLSIPVKHIVKAYANEKGLMGFVGIRMPGTQIPGIITAGTYLVEDGTIFCDVTNPEKSIVVELADEKYSKLVIDVADKEAAIEMLNAK
jgi:hypothetical protein